MLGQSPVNFKSGGPWAVIEGIEPIFVWSRFVSGSTIFCHGDFCSECGYQEEMRFEVILKMMIRVGLAEWFCVELCNNHEAFSHPLEIWWACYQQEQLQRFPLIVHRRILLESWIWRKSSHADTGSTVVDYYLLSVAFHYLYGIFPFLKDSDYCTDGNNRIFNYGWK